MFARVVVPVDGSSRSFDAVRAGSALAAAGGARLEAVMVIDWPADQLDEEARLGEQLRGLDLPLEPIPVVLAGESAAATLAGYLAEGLPAQVVMASTGRGRSAGVIGSVAEELLAADVGPIVVLGPHAAADRLLSGEAIVPLDGSHLSEQALELAAAWCTAVGSRPWVVSVLPTTAGAQADLDMSESVYVKRQAARLEEQLGRDVEYEVLHGGAPGPVIADYADSTGAGVILMTTHGRSGLRRMVMGSVAADVIRQAPCPVLLGRPTAREDAATTA